MKPYLLAMLTIIVMALGCLTLFAYILENTEFATLVLVGWVALFGCINLTKDEMFGGEE